MSLTGKITNLFADKAMTIPAFPRTKIKAVSDDNGVGLDAILNNMVHAEEYSPDVAITPLNADTLGGHTIDSLKTLIVNSIYPIGSIYTSISSTSPAVLFGGVWEQIKDTFLLSAGNTYAAGSTGGEAEHTLTTSELPNSAWTSTEQSGGVDTYFSKGNSYGMHTQGTDIGKPHNNMPPYLAVYMWKRTA